MTTQYMDEGGFKKKFLAPLVVIMVCAVALAGAAYAYSTSVHGNGNVPVPDYYSIDLYELRGGEYVPVSDNLSTNDKFVTTTAKYKDDTHSDNYYGEVTATSLVYVYYVKVTANIGVAESTYKFTEQTATYSKQSGTAEMYSAWTSESVVCNVVITDISGSAVTSFSVNTIYKVVITVELTALSVDLGTAIPEHLGDLTAFNGTDCISLTLTAGSVSSA